MFRAKAKPGLKIVCRVDTLYWFALNLNMSKFCSVYYLQHTYYTIWSGSIGRVVHPFWLLQYDSLSCAAWILHREQLTAFLLVTTKGCCWGLMVLEVELMIVVMVVVVFFSVWQRSWEKTWIKYLPCLLPMPVQPEKPERWCVNKTLLILFLYSIWLDYRACSGTKDIHMAIVFSRVKILLKEGRVYRQSILPPC